MRRVVESVPAALVALSIAPFTLGLKEVPSSIGGALQGGSMYAWLWLLTLGCLSVIAGVWLRTTEPSEIGEIGLGFQLLGYPLVGGMVLAYAAATAWRFGVIDGWSSFFSLIALSTVFLGSAVILIGDLWRARRTGLERGDE